MGKQIIPVHGSLDWKECLTVYWGRDIIEKAFRSLKTDLQVMPLNVGTEATLKGYLFITFLSPILRVRLLKHMRIPVCWSTIPWRDFSWNWQRSRRSGW